MCGHVSVSGRLRERALPFLLRYARKNLFEHLRKQLNHTLAGLGRELEIKKTVLVGQILALRRSHDTTGKVALVRTERRNGRREIQPVRTGFPEPVGW